MGEARAAEMMDEWVEVERVEVADGIVLLLRRCGERFEIRCGGLQLMADYAHYSEQTFGRLGCSFLRRRAAQRVLIGGLGLGYSLRAALDALPARAEVEVAELFAQVVAWNQSVLGALAGHPLADPRVKVVVGAVAARLAAGAFDAILLDVDNGPEAVMLPGNASLYTEAGLSRVIAALRPGGRLGVWSADDSPRFEATLARAGLRWWRRRVAARGRARDPRHTLYFAVEQRRG